MSDELPGKLEIYGEISLIVTPFRNCQGLLDYTVEIWRSRADDMDVYWHTNCYGPHHFSGLVAAVERAQAHIAKLRKKYGESKIK